MTGRVERLRVGDTELVCEVEGEGPPLVLVHGFAASRRVWDDVVPLLGRDRKVARFDLRGHGESGGPDDERAYRLWRLAADVVGVVEGLGLERPVLAGHSLGGSAAMWAALLRPDLFGGLVLVNSWAFETTPRRRARQRRMLRSARLLGMQRAYALSGGAIGRPEEWRQLRRAAFFGIAEEVVAGRSFRPWLWQLRVPTAFVCGERDAGFVPAMRALHATVPGAVWWPIPTAGHNPMLETPGEVAGALVEALGGREPGRTRPASALRPRPAPG